MFLIYMIKFVSLDSSRQLPAVLSGCAAGKIVSGPRSNLHRVSKNDTLLRCTQHTFKFSRFFKLYIFWKALLDVAYLQCRHVRNSTAALTTHTLVKLLIKSI